mmetsp:Transcript_53387/g.88694  ORF Transcript_53387/g.88694 Transcript_53387/m.88694 type:complete len:244 (+) Transcript_53387:241-972(+)
MRTMKDEQKRGVWMINETEVMGLKGRREKKGKETEGRAQFSLLFSFFFKRRRRVVFSSSVRHGLLVLVEEEVVAGTDGDKLLLGVDGGVEALLGVLEGLRRELTAGSGRGGLDLSGGVELVGLDGGDLIRNPIVDVEHVVVRSSHHSVSVGADLALELVKDAVVLVEIAELGSEVVVDVDDLDGLALHVHVPDLDGEVITGDDVATVAAELAVRDGRDDFREEGARARVLFLLKALCVRVAEG